MALGCLCRPHMAPVATSYAGGACSAQYMLGKPCSICFEWKVSWELAGWPSSAVGVQQPDSARWQCCCCAAELCFLFISGLHSFSLHSKRLPEVVQLALPEFHMVWRLHMGLDLLLVCGHWPTCMACMTPVAAGIAGVAGLWQHACWANPAALAGLSWQPARLSRWLAEHC